MERRIAFFDFDKTIIKSDSMFDFLLFTLKINPMSCFTTFLSISVSVIKYIFSSEKDIKIIKEGIFYMIRHLKEEDLIMFTKKVLLEEKFFKSSLEEIHKRRQEGCLIVIVSASPELYLKQFYNLLDIDKIIGTKIDDNGKIIGGNCKHIEKVNRIEDWLADMEIKIDYENSYCYSDSFSADKPMFELVKNRYLINSDKKLEEYNNLKWE